MKIINILHFTIHVCYIFTCVNGLNHLCNERKLPINELVTGVEIDDFPPNARVKRSDEKIRIHLEYLPSFTNDHDADLLKKQFLEPAINVLRNAVKPKIPVVGILRVDRNCAGRWKIKLSDNGKIMCKHGCVKTTCLDEQIPEKFLKKCKLPDSNNNYYENGTEGEGVANTDLVILVIRKSCSANELAWAVSCALEKTLDRPILGLINVCSTGIKANENIEMGINTIIHELIHVLGFSSSRYAYFRDRAGNPLVPRDYFNDPDLGMTDNQYNFNDKIAKEVIRQRYSKQLNYTKKIYALTLPNVVKEAQNFFNCSLMTEVDLEDTGSRGNVMSHFDEYVFHDEMMSSMSFKVENMTRLTLAFLYDTGWYDVNYCAAKPMRYGYKAGCTLPLEGCYKYMIEKKAKNESIDPFCDKNYDSASDLLICSPDYKTIDYCKIKRSIDPKYEYLESQMSGDEPMMEYCPIYFSEMCESKGIDIPMAYELIYGIDSRCSGNNVKPENNQFGGVTCLKTTCKSNKYLLTTVFGDLTCINSKDVTVHSITFKCIPQNTMCPRTNGTICEFTNEIVPIINSITIKPQYPMNKTFSGAVIQTTHEIKEKMRSKNTSRNIQISLIHLLLYFIVIVCLLP